VAFARVLVLLAVIVGVAASAAKSVTSERPVVVTRSVRPLDADCSPRRIAVALRSLTTSFNRGDIRAVVRRFSGSFQWYTVSEAGEQTARVFRRADLFGYFRARHAAGERMRLLMLDVSNGVGHVGSSLVLLRPAPDLAAGVGGTARLAEGKADVDCSTGTINVLSLSMDAASEGQPVPDGVVWPCRRPQGWTHRSRPIIACARG
jgi:hypothetical protein